MSDSSDEFGYFDAEAMEGACTQAELAFRQQAVTTQARERPTKRRRTAGPERSHSLTSTNGELRGTEDSIPLSDSEGEPQMSGRRCYDLQNTLVDDSKGRTITGTQTGQHENVRDNLKNLPSDALFSAPQGGDSVIEVFSQVDYQGRWKAGAYMQVVREPQKNLKQRTLFGGDAQAVSMQTNSQSSRRHNLSSTRKDEPKTHHALDNENIKTWVYPMNLGKERAYQFSIVSGGLFNNLLVALPTGLGKTFIAATIMLNWYRWTKTAQIIFVAPTKPLVAQQVDACFKVVGIPRSDTIMLTGETPPGVRAMYWKDKRVFFMTPQTVMNDMSEGYADPKRTVLLVVDEAHRATGKYAYVQIVNKIRQYNPSFRVLGLTATPGSTVEGVQEVIDGLNIARTEIRTEESIDIRDYVHNRTIEPKIFDYSEEMTVIMNLFSRTLRPLMQKVRSQNSYIPGDPMNLNAYMCSKLSTQWMQSDAGRKAHWGVKNMMLTIFSTLASLGVAIELLKFHSIGSFYRKIADFRTEVQKSKSTYKNQVINDSDFKKMMSTIESWKRNEDFIGHPKLEFLRQRVLDHFLEAGEGCEGGTAHGQRTQTRIMVFAHYRDSAEEIVRVLKRNEPLIRPHVFVGQATSSESEGMGQKKQLSVISDFKAGVFNSLVATSIGEEGLDIGEVDLIICYDASASPIRMLQRMGRTGRKRAGMIDVFLMKGKEEDKFRQAKDNYEKMQGMIEDGRRFKYHADSSPRIIPRTVQPELDKKVIDIPQENSQAGLPVPEKRLRVPKKPPKKFHMPDNVVTGFRRASRLVDDVSSAEDEGEPSKPSSPHSVPVEPVKTVLLTKEEENQLENDYLNVHGTETQLTRPPNMSAQRAYQRRLRPTKHLRHGHATKRFVRMMNAIHDVCKATNDDLFWEHLASEDHEDINKYYSRRGQEERVDPLSSKSLVETEEENMERRLAFEPCDIPDDRNSLDKLEDGDSLKDFLDDGEESEDSHREENLSSPSLPLVEDETVLSSIPSDDELPCVEDLLNGPVQRASRPATEAPGRRQKRPIMDSEDDS